MIMEIITSKHKNKDMADLIIFWIKKKYNKTATLRSISRPLNNSFNIQSEHVYSKHHSKACYSLKSSLKITME